MTKVIQPNGAWIMQLADTAGKNTAGQNPSGQSTPLFAAPITDSTPVPAPIDAVAGALNPQIPARDISLTSVSGVNFQSTGSDTSVAAPVSAQGSGVKKIQSISFRNPA